MIQGMLTKIHLFKISNLNQSQEDFPSKNV